LQTFPRLRLRSGLEDDAGVAVRAADALLAADRRHGAPDPAVVIHPELGRGVRRRLIGDIEQVPAPLRLVVDRQRRPEGSARILALELTARFEDRGHAGP